MITAVNLKTEYLTDTAVIDSPHPRLSWNVSGAAKQSAYRIKLTSEGRCVFDSGIVRTDAMHCTLSGTELSSRQYVGWSIQLLDENGTAGDWSHARFEMGLLCAEDWKALWITGDYRPAKRKRYPVDCFRKIFTVSDAVKAKLYVTACGLYTAELNGRRVGNFAFAPGFTDYRKRIQYQVYDVSDLLVSGENIITFSLADGWFRGSCGALGSKNQYGTETKLLAQLEITDSRGSRSFICTDGTWEWSNDGPIRFADNKDGEKTDARMTPGYGGRARVTAYGVIPSASNNVPVTEHEIFTPTELKRAEGRILLDFGQNIAGFVSFRINAHAGQRVKMRMGEMLDSKCDLTLSNIQVDLGGILSPMQEIEYICREGENAYKTTFAVFGFRYAEVETDIPVNAEAFSAHAVYSALPRTGYFECSEPLINSFVNATVWSAKGNHLDIPTDCPTRERLGWAGDAQIFFETAAFLFDYFAFAKKYLNDLFDEQEENGSLPQIAPYAGVPLPLAPLNGSVGWADAGILIPYRFWKLTGDIAILEEYYDRMCRYADFMMRRIGKNTLYAPRVRLPDGYSCFVVNKGRSYGEWAEPEDVSPTSWTNTFEIHTEVSTAYTAYVLGIMSEISKLCGDNVRSRKYAAAADSCTAAYRSLVRTEKYSLDTDRQASLVRPLYMGLLDLKQREYAKKRLLTALENYGWRLGTGFLSTPLILDVLSETDIEAAYRLLENKKLPGWLYMTKQNATTVWECWEGPNAQSGVGSLNHYSKGAVCSWLFSTVCGINTAGENRFLISPRPGGSLTWAKAELSTVFGKVVSEWHRGNGGISYSVSVPCNCTAELVLPGAEKMILRAGTYTFTR